MRQRRAREAARETKHPDRTSAVSESIGAILLVSVVAMFIGLIGISLFSMQAPAKVPNLNFMAGLNDAQTILSLYHNGGDTLTVGEFSVLVDGVSKPYTVSGGGSQWSLGKNLIVPVTTKPTTVQIVYNGTGVGGTGGALLLHSGSVNRTKTVNITEDRTPYLDCAAVMNYDCADQIPPWIIVDRYTKNSTTRRVLFSQSWQARGIIRGGGTSGQYHFNFTVSGGNSSIHIANPANPNCDGGTLYSLPIGTEVGIVLTDNPEFLTVYGMAPQIWELTAGTAARVTTKLKFTNGTTLAYAGRTVCQGYVSQYSALDSTITVITQTTGRTTSLTLNNTVVFPGSTSARTFNLTNIQPMDNGLFLVTYGGANTPVYLIGWPSNLSWT